MKKLIKSALSIALVVTMLLSLGAVAFAENPGVISSHVEFEVTAEGVSAKAFVRDLNTKYKHDVNDIKYNDQGKIIDDGYSIVVPPRNAELILAVYDASGKLKNAVTHEKIGGTLDINRILKTAPVKVEDGETAKAFVWVANSKKIVSDVAVYQKNGYDFEDVLDTLEITFDGKSFESFVGTAFNKATTTYNAGKVASIPNIKATVDDNATHVTAYNSGSAYIVEVKSTVDMGEDLTFTVKTHRGSTDATAYRPNYTYSRTYTINYTIAEAAAPDKINPEKEILFLNASNLSGMASTPSAGWGNTNYAMINTASAEISVSSDPVKVDVTVDNSVAATANGGIDDGTMINQKMFIVVRPANGSVNGINNRVIVNADGSSLNPSATINDTYKTSVWNEETQTVDHTYYKRSSNAPVVYTDLDSEVAMKNGSANPNATTNLWVGYELNGSTDKGDTGAYAFNRSPKTEMLALREANNVIKNAEWIPLNSNTATAKGTFTFYIGQSAVIDVYTRTSDGYYRTNTPLYTDITIEKNDEIVPDEPIITEKALAGFTQAGAITQACFNDTYKLYYDLTLAYFDAMGYKDGIEYDTSGGRLIVYNSINPDGWIGKNDNTDKKDYHGNWIAIGLSKTGEKVSNIAGSAVNNVVNPQTDARFWKDGIVGGTPKTRAELAQLFDSSYEWPKKAEFKLPATDFEYVVHPTEFAATYGAAAPDAGWIKCGITSFIPGTTTETAYKANFDGTTNITLKLTDYETLLELEGAACVNPSASWLNGNVSQKSGVTQLGVPTDVDIYYYLDGEKKVYDTKVNIEKASKEAIFEQTIPSQFDKPFYTLKVEQDSEVIVVMPNGNSYGRTPENANDGWIWNSYQMFNSIICAGQTFGGFFNATANPASLGYNTSVSFRYAEAGETITIRVPNSARPFVFVRPL